MVEETDNLYGQFDAAKWADAFTKRHPDIDWGEAVAWFANAIMTGYDAGLNQVDKQAKSNIREVWIEGYIY